jgi:hypothetical protein
VLVALFASLRVNPASFVAPLDRAERLVDQTLTLTDGSATNEGIARARDERVATEALDPVLVEAARGRAVHVDPVDAGLPWAQRLPWNPLPVFQTYSAYTAFLDDRNAAALRGPNAPPLLIREIGQTLDARNPAWESPAAMREMLCHYRAIESGPRWQLLERSPPRCGDERPLASIKVALWAPVPIPPAPDASNLVFARIDGIAVGGLERLRTTFYRAAPRSVVLDGNRTFRLIPGTAANGLVLRVPRSADFPAPFAFDQGADTMTVTRGSGPQDGEVRIRFFAVTIR